MRSTTFSFWCALGMIAVGVGCSPQPVSSANPVSAAPATPVSAIAAPTSGAASSTTADAPAPLREGMAYADLRRIVLERGWRPKVDAQCKVNVVGANHVQVCAADAALCRVCDDLPELSSCSADGHCLMAFERDAGGQLSVSTYGEVKDWNASGSDAGLFVKWWDPENF